MPLAHRARRGHRSLAGLAIGLAAGERSRGQLTEERVWPIRTALELWVGLRPDPEWMVGELHELDEPVVGEKARAPQAGGVEALPDA